jgi:hypothetical protein
MRGLHIPISDFPEILNDELTKIKDMVFLNNETTIYTFNGYANFYTYTGTIYDRMQVNKIATYFKRLYSGNYSIKNVVRGPILVCGSQDGIPGIIDTSVPHSFVEQLFLYYNMNPYEYPRN